MLVFLRVYACVYVPYMAMHALRVAVGIGGLRLESIFERVSHQPALAGGMRALHTKFVRILTKISNTLLHDYSTVSMTPPPSQDQSRHRIEGRMQESSREQHGDEHRVLSTSPQSSMFDEILHISYLLVHGQQ